MPFFSQPRLDVVVVIDHSASTFMFINELNAAVNVMINSLKNDPQLSGYAVYLTIIQFNHECNDKDDILLKEKLVKDISASEIENITKITASGATNPAPALRKAIDICMSRYEAMRNEGDDRRHPIIYYFSDGIPDAGEIKGVKDPKEQEKVDHDYEEAAKLIRSLEVSKKLLFIGCGFSHEGRKADMDKLRMLTNFSNHTVEICGKISAEALNKFFGDIIPKTIEEHTKDSDIHIEQIIYSE